MPVIVHFLESKYFFRVIYVYNKYKSVKIKCVYVLCKNIKKSRKLKTQMNKIIE